MKSTEPVYFTEGVNQIKTVRVPVGYEIEIVPIGSTPSGGNTFPDGIKTPSISDLNGNKYLEYKNGTVDIVPKLTVNGQEVVVVGPDGKISSTVLPSIAVSDVVVLPMVSGISYDDVAQAAITAEAAKSNTVHEGDIIIVVNSTSEDLIGEYIVTTETLSTGSDLVKFTSSGGGGGGSVPQATTTQFGTVILAASISEFETGVATSPKVFEFVNDIKTDLESSIQENTNKISDIEDLLPADIAGKTLATTDDLTTKQDTLIVPSDSHISIDGDNNITVVTGTTEGSIPELGVGGKLPVSTLSFPTVSVNGQTPIGVDAGLNIALGDIVTSLSSDTPEFTFTETNGNVVFNGDGIVTRLEDVESSVIIIENVLPADLTGKTLATTDDLTTKQDVLTAGAAISIAGNTIGVITGESEGQVPVLGADGLLSRNILPSIAISDVDVINDASISTMNELLVAIQALGKTLYEGDVIILPNAADEQLIGSYIVASETLQTITDLVKLSVHEIPEVPVASTTTSGTVTLSTDITDSTSLPSLVFSAATIKPILESLQGQINAQNNIITVLESNLDSVTTRLDDAEAEIAALSTIKQNTLITGEGVEIVSNEISITPATIDEFGGVKIGVDELTSTVNIELDEVTP